MVMVKNSKLAAEVHRVLMAHGSKGRPLSLRKTEERTGISYSTVLNLSQGRPNAKPETILMFARAFREDEGYWLQLCGYDSTYRPPLDTSDIDDPDLRRLGRMLMRIPESKRAIAVQAAEAMFSGMALVE